MGGHSAEHDSNMLLEGGQSFLDNAPNDFEVHTEVLVNEHVTECRDAPPGDAGVTLPQVRWQLLYRFADYLQVAYDRVLDHGVVEERLPALTGVGFDSGDRVLDVLQIDRRILHSGRASRRMSFRRYGLRLASVRTSTRQPR